MAPLISRFHSQYHQNCKKSDPSKYIFQTAHLSESNFYLNSKTRETDNSATNRIDKQQNLECWVDLNVSYSKTGANTKSKITSTVCMCICNVCINVMVKKDDVLIKAERVISHNLQVSRYLTRWNLLSVHALKYISLLYARVVRLLVVFRAGGRKRN